MTHKEQSAAPAGHSRHGAVCDAASRAVPEAPCPPPPRTFFGLGVGDLQVTVGCLQLLAAHDLALEVAQGDVEAVEGDRIIVQLGEELIVNTRHGEGQVVPALQRRLPRQMAWRPPRWVRAHGDTGKGHRGGRGKQSGLSSSGPAMLRGRGALAWPGPTASARLGW